MVECCLKIMLPAGVNIAQDLNMSCWFLLVTQVPRGSNEIIGDYCAF